MASIKESETTMPTATTEVPASKRLLALYPNLHFDRTVVMKVLEEKSFMRTKANFEKLSGNVTLQDLLACFRSDSSAEEFLWYYIEAVTGETNVCDRTY